LKTLLETLARELVSEPQRVRVTERAERGFVQLELAVAPQDRGRVIGRQGRTADELRTLLGAVARYRGTRCRVEIVE
jgi:predicted RNA-binding protein YlqC (UPF0109 family)